MNFRISTSCGFWDKGLKNMQILLQYAPLPVSRLVPLLELLGHQEQLHLLQPWCHQWLHSLALAW